MEKSLFVKLMGKIQKAFDKEETFNNALDEYDDENYHCFLPNRILVERAVVPFITQSLGLDPEKTTDTGLIEWFIFDCDFGRKADTENKNEEEKICEVSIELTTKKNEKVEKAFVIHNSGDFYDFVKTLLEERQKDGNTKESDNK